jgi:DNA-binding LacI/PurR family transcriptional regulator
MEDTHMAVRKKRNTIGVIIPSYIARYSDRMLTLLSRSFRQHGYQVIIAQTDSDITQEIELLSYFAKTADCIFVVSAAERYSAIEDAVPKQIPVIFLYNRPIGCPKTCILESDYSAIYQGIVSTMNRGHSKIACICPSLKLSSTVEAIRAYKDATARAGERCEEAQIHEVSVDDDFSMHRLVESVIESGCTAIFTTTPTLTLLVMDFLIFYNTNPDHKPISLLGYGNVDGILTSQMHIDLINHPTEQLVTLARDQATYQMNHLSARNERVYLLKGTLQMHTYNGFNLQDDY